MSDNQQLLEEEIYNVFSQELWSKYKIFSTLSVNQINDKYSSYINLPNFVLEMHDAYESAIPRIMHYVWLTNESKPKQVPEPFLANLKSELDKLHDYNVKSPEPWKVKFWVNCKSCIALSLDKISEMGYPVEIMEWQSEMYGHRSNLQEFVINLSHMRNGMGAGYDVARLIIAEKYGGFFPDFNYNTGNSTEIVVQRGYNSISFTENSFFGFKPQHDVLISVNNYTSDSLEIVEKYNFSSKLSILNSNTMVGLFGYGPLLMFADLFVGKEDLYRNPECSICDIIDNLSIIDPYGFQAPKQDDDIKQCSMEGAEICYIAEHQLTGGACFLVIEDSGIDFGVDSYVPPDYNGSSISLSWSAEYV